jgi:hypothetical protein
MGSRDQLANKRSDYANQGGADLLKVAEVVSVQVAAEPTTGDKFFVTPLAYRFTSASGELEGVFNGYWGILLGGNVSATCSAMSAAFNLATSYGATNDGVTAATSTGSTSDLTLTAATAGNDIQYGNKVGAGLVFAEVTGNVGGNILPEGFISYTTSAGNTIYAKDPAEATRLRLQFPEKQG